MIFLPRRRRRDRRPGRIGKRGRGVVWGSLVLFSVALFLVIAGAGEAAEARGGVAAEVNQAPITAAAVDEALQAYLRQIGHRELSASRMAELRREILERLIEDELIYQEGIRKGETVGDDELAAEAARLRNRFPSQEAYESALAKEKLSREQIESGLRRFILIRKTWDAASSMTDEGKRTWLKEMRERSEIKVY